MKKVGKEQSIQYLMKANEISLTGTQLEQQNFCSLWPNVKSGLQVLITIVKNPIAKGAIQVVITAGDAVSSRICPEQLAQ